jgi:hypothetical protein
VGHEHCEGIDRNVADELQKRIREEQLTTVNTHCPRCGDPVDIARRYEAAESGNTTVFFSRKCREKWGKKRRHAKKIASEADVQ